ncbi:MAG TPA: hypothetical protein VFF63_05460 [Candidatus Babeliales bacterium]|nr:hypothetical protein [Candidatus Babeliales bacterium]
MLILMRSSLLLGFALILCASTRPIVASAGQYPAHVEILSLRLESSKTIYRLGEPIELRVTIRNNTAQEYAFQGYTPPYGLCTLEVLNARGDALRSKGAIGYRQLDISSQELPAETSTVAAFEDPAAAGALREWANIRYWGYHIEQPGDYTVFAIPNFTAFAMHHDGPDFTGSAPDRSNAVTFKVVQ